MTEVTAVVDRKEITGVQGMEIVNVTFTDGQTYTSKFGKVYAAFINNKSRSGAYISDITGGVVTLACSSASGDSANLLIIGS